MYYLQQMKDEKLKRKLEEIERLKKAINKPLRNLPKIGDVSHIGLKNAPPKFNKN
jgi:hypothetical protein